MDIFNLPDLGEGLPDAEIHEWFVKEGDKVELDQPLVAMETAKAVVDVPSPQSGVVQKLYGKPGDLIKTGMPLVEFASEALEKKDKGTVVGNLLESHEISEDLFTIGTPSQTNASRPKATPMVRTLAKKLQVDLSALKGSGEHGLITREDVEKAAQNNQTLPEGYEALRGTRRTMLHSMLQSHKEVVPVSIFDEADIHAWQADEDITVRLIQAIIKASDAEPALNAWFEGNQSAKKTFKEVHLGLAMDTEDGLFVPVIHHAENYNAKELRNQIETFKHSVRDRSVSPENLKGATFVLSNFGKFAGRFASPIIVPPTVAILGVGKIYEKTVLNQGVLESHKIIPLSLSFDHRAATGGEATRFLGLIIEALSR